MTRRGRQFKQPFGQYEKRKWDHRARKALDTCAALTCIRIPVNDSLTSAASKVHALRRSVGRPAHAINSTRCSDMEADMAYAESIEVMAHEIGALRSDVQQSRDLLHALLLACDRFLKDTQELPQEMTSSSLKVRTNPKHQPIESYGTFPLSFDNIICGMDSAYHSLFPIYMALTLRL
jgi:hypothetical protein